MALREGLVRVLTEYLDAKRDPMKDHPLMAFRRQLESTFADSEPVQNRPNLHVSVSFGRGNWATVPWIAFLDDRETTSTQRGVYPVYLFRADMAGVYLTFNQGVTEIKEKHGTGKDFRDYFAGMKETLTPYAEPLKNHGFSLDDDIDLAADASLGRQYEVSTVAYKHYPRDEMPPEEVLESDLEAVLQVYDDYLQDARETIAPEDANQDEEGRTAPTKVPQELSEVLSAVTASRGLMFPQALLLAFQTGLSCQPFTLLAGPTGTGKTSLALALDDSSDFVVETVEVEGGWLDSASAFGYISPATQDFVPGPILLRLLEVLTKAEEEDSLPVLLLDEINVSPPHIYLAPVLSALERAFTLDKPVSMPIAQSGMSETSRTAIREAEELHPELTANDVGPFVRLEVDLPPTLRVVGTLNFDASTEDLAPKLLSRSFVVWFETPRFGDDLEPDPQTSYSIVPDSNPLHSFAKTCMELGHHDFPVTARSVDRAKTAFAHAENHADRLVDVLLSGLVLPQLQTVMGGTAEESYFDAAFLDGLPDGLFKGRLEKMREQLRSEGMANLWLVAQ